MTTAVLTYFTVQEINWKKISISGSIIGLALLIFYVLQVNALTAGAYYVKSYEKQITKLAQENRNLQVSFAESSFLGQALTKIQLLNFQKNITVKYVQIPNNTVEVARANIK